MDSGDGLYKIGHSSNPEGRAATLKAELIGWVETRDMLWLERYLHVAYSEFREHGEWFRLPPYHLAEVLALPDPVHSEDDIIPAIRLRFASAHSSPESEKVDRGNVVTLRLSDDLMAALNAFSDSLPYRPRKSAVLRKGLEMLLQQHGFFPPRKPSS